MSFQCQGKCSCSEASCLTLGGLCSAIVVAVVFVVLLLFISLVQYSPISAEEVKPNFGDEKESMQSQCVSMDEVKKAASDGKCWVVYDNAVYDVTQGKQWSLTGHLDQHFCGTVFDKKTIEAGQHTVEVMDTFRLAPLCLEESQESMQTSVTGDVGEVKNIASDRGNSEGIFLNWLRRPLGLKGWRVLFAYLSGLFFILNFATCFAMPWAKWRVPDVGCLVGRDKRKNKMRFPLTYWHVRFAWAAVFSFAVHGILELLCLWGMVCL